MRLAFVRLWVVVVSFLFLALACGGGDDAASSSSGNTTGADASIGTSDASTTASCTDGQKNGAESDVDCGGSCAKCASGKTCGGPSDCSSGVCTNGTCVTPPGAPTITSFTAAKTTITSGTSTTLTAVFAGGTGSVDNGVGAVTTAVAKTTGNLTATTTFTLTVTSAGGQTATQVVTVDVVAAPVITSFVSDKAKVTTGKAAMLTATFTGGTGTVDKGVGAVTTAAAKSTGNLTTDTTFTLTVTNSIGDSVTAQVLVQVVAAPTITSFTAAAAKIGSGTPASLTGVFAGGTGSIDQGVGAVTSGVAKATGNVAAKITFTLTVTNEAGDSVTATLEISVVKELFVTDYGAFIRVYDHDATGNAAAKRTISGNLTTLSNARGLAVANDEIFVAIESGINGIRVFDVNANGNVAPKRSLGGASAQFQSPTSLFVTNGEIFVSNRSYGSPANASVAVYDVGDDGDVVPKRRIQGSQTFLNNPNGIAVDNGEIYVVNESLVKRINVFPVNATGDVAPTRFIATDSSCTGLMVAGSEVFVTTDETPARVLVYDKMSGALVRQIGGANTGFAYYNEQCAVIGTELLCANFDSGTLRGFPIGGSGNIAPIRTLATASPLGVFAY